MSLSLALTGLDTSNPIPGIYAELRFAQGETGGDLGPKKMLVLAPKTSAGSMTADTQVVGPLSDEADVITYAGTGSIGHAMCARILKLNKSINLYLAAPTAATGSAAVEKITFVNAATGAGVHTVFVCGKKYQTAIVSGDAIATIATNVAATLNNDTSLPFTAGAALGVVTLTARVAGEEYNSIRIRCEITSGITTTTTLTADTAFGASGAGGAAIGVGTISYTTVLATILGTRFHYIVPAVQVAAPIDALLDQVSTQAEPSTGFRQKVVVGSCLTPSNATTLASGASMNRPRARLVNQEEGPEPHYMIAATAAAVFAKIEASDPSYNFDGYGLHANDNFPLQRPYNDSAIPTTTEVKSMLNNGVTPIGVNVNGAAYIVRSVTTYCLNGASYDYRARDSSVVAVGDAFTDDTVAAIGAAPWTHITGDPANISQQPAAKFCTPKRMASLIEGKVYDYLAAGYLDPDKVTDMLESIQTGQDPTLPTRMNSVVPIYSAVLLHQHALLVKESSAAALPDNTTTQPQRPRRHASLRGPGPFPFVPPTRPRRATWPAISFTNRRRFSSTRSASPSASRSTSRTCRAPATSSRWSRASPVSALAPR